MYACMYPLLKHVRALLYLMYCCSKSETYAYAHAYVINAHFTCTCPKSETYAYAHAYMHMLKPQKRMHTHSHIHAHAQSQKRMHTS